MRNRLSATILVSVVIAASLSALVVARYASREPNLLERAKFVVETDEWEFDNAPYWMSDHELMIVRGSHDRTHRTVDSVAKLDTNTQTESPLEGLTEAIKHLGGGFTTDTILISPDGKRVATTRTVLETSGKTVWTTKDLGIDGWAGDADHLVCSDWDTDSGNRTLVDVRGTGAAHTTQLKWSARPSDVDRYLSASNVLSISEWNWIDAAKPVSRITITQTRTVDGLLLTRNVVALPQKSEVKAIAFDQTGKCVLLQLNDECSSPFAKLLHQLVHQPPPPTQIHESLWIYGTDGSETRCVGSHYFAKPPADADEDEDSDALSAIEWVPGDRQVSFVQHDKLYTVPTN